MKVKVVVNDGNYWVHVEPSDGKGFYRVRLGSKHTEHGFTPFDGYPQTSDKDLWTKEYRL